MSIEILDRGACKAAGLMIFNPFPGVNVFSGEGVSALESVDLETVRLTLVEPIGSAEFLALQGPRSTEAGEACSITWETDTTFLIANVAADETVLVDLMIFRLVNRGAFTSPALEPPEWTLTELGDTGLSELWSIGANAITGRLVAGGDVGGAYSDDAGLTWTPCAGLAGAGTVYAIAWRSAGFMAGCQNGLFFSADGITFGATAAVANPGWEGLVWDAATARWIGTNRNPNAVWSSNDGVAWAEVNPVPDYPHCYQLAVNPLGTAIAAGFTETPDQNSASAMRTVDGGATWTDLGVLFGSALEPDYAQGICWIESLSRWLTASGYDDSAGGHGAYASDDGGTTWNPVGGVIDAISLMAASADAALMTGAAGVRVSEDGGATAPLVVGSAPGAWYGPCWSAFHDAFFVTSTAGTTVARVKLE